MKKSNNQTPADRLNLVEEPTILPPKQVRFTHVPDVGDKLRDQINRQNIDSKVEEYFRPPTKPRHYPGSSLNLDLEGAAPPRVKPIIKPDPGYIPTLQNHIRQDHAQNKVSTIIDANSALADRDFFRAEYILGRPLTVSEITNRSISGTRLDQPSKATSLSKPASNGPSFLLPPATKPLPPLPPDTDPDWFDREEYDPRTFGVDDDDDDELPPLENPNDDYDTLVAEEERHQQLAQTIRNNKEAEKQNDLKDKYNAEIKKAAAEMSEIITSFPNTFKDDSKAYKKVYQMDYLKKLYDRALFVNPNYENPNMDAARKLRESKYKQELFLALLNTLEMNLPVEYIPLTKVDERERVKFGLGAKKGHQRTPPLKLQQFGKLGIDLTQLNKNVLSVVHHHNKHKVTGIKNAELTTKSKNVVLSLLQGLEPDVKGLSQAEKELIAKLIRASKTSAKVQGKIPKVTSLNPAKNPHALSDVDKLRESFQVLVGSIEAKNDSVLLKNNLSILLNTMLERGLITKKQLLDCHRQYIGNI